METRLNKKPSISLLITKPNKRMELLDKIQYER